MGAVGNHAQSTVMDSVSVRREHRSRRNSGCLRHAAANRACFYLRAGDRADFARVVVGAGRRLRRIVVAWVGVLLSGNALAQMAAEAGIASDNIYRGVSLNAGAPAPVVDLGFDGSAGWYVGGSASAVRFYQQYHSSAQIVLDAGYARATAAGIAWEVGAATSDFPDFAFYNYTQMFAGLAADNWNARVYFAPDYFGRHLRTLYAEFNYAHPLGERVRLLAHVGALQELSAQTGGNAPTFDTSLGVGVKLRAVDLRLEWVDRSRANYLYPVAMGDTRHRWMLSVAYVY